MQTLKQKEKSTLSLLTMYWFRPSELDFVDSELSEPVFRKIS